MSGLIVDFPSQTQMSKLHTKSKNVQFSPTSSLLIYEPQHDVKHFYSKHEYQAMKFANQQDVGDLRKIYVPLLSKSRPLISKEKSEELGDLMHGNEKSLTPKLARKVQVSKKYCLYAVLEEQARQSDSGECDPEELARASRQFSKSDKQRAQAIGRLQSGKDVSSDVLAPKRIFQR